jgi:hypothetical protein
LIWFAWLDVIVYKPVLLWIQPVFAHSLKIIKDIPEKIESDFLSVISQYLKDRKEYVENKHIVGYPLSMDPNP